MFQKIIIIVLLSIILLFSTSGCLTNILNCPEDIPKTSSCPTEAKKEEDRFFWLLLIIVATDNNGNGWGKYK
ncbi:MAG: hypothetical protein H7A23_02765 [Leptospiraceae bacterium]|nr:hypothetical protein [Leptospiraceae bacterium]MCP5493454.1 hypothetical protein [Leptospiraceae bacterium]